MENEINNLVVQDNISNEEIKNLIYTIRGKQVMLDSDVAMLYHYPTKRINEAVNRNKQRFPDNFCFQLTEEEYKLLRCKNSTLNEVNSENIIEDKSLRSQIATLDENTGRGKHRKYLPYVFTEQGIAMLSGLLKNDIAIQVSINIMNAFVEMRKYINLNKHLFEKVVTIKSKMDKKFIEEVQKILTKINKKLYNV